MFITMLMNGLCGHFCIPDVTPHNPCHYYGKITSGGEDMRLSWRSLRLCWPRMHCDPKIMSAERCSASQDASHGHCFCKSFPARILTRLNCSHSLCSCVNNPLDDSLSPRVNIIPKNILPLDHSKIGLNRVNLISVFTYYQIH